MPLTDGLWALWVFLSGLACGPDARGLGDPTFAAREAAAARLAAAGWLAYPVLRAAREHHPAPEARRRADALAAPLDARRDQLRAALVLAGGDPPDGGRALWLDRDLRRRVHALARPLHSPGLDWLLPETDPGTVGDGAFTWGVPPWRWAGDAARFARAAVPRPPPAAPPPRPR